MKHTLKVPLQMIAFRIRHTFINLAGDQKVLSFQLWEMPEVTETNLDCYRVRVTKITASITGSQESLEFPDPLNLVLLFRRGFEYTDCIRFRGFILLQKRCSEYGIKLNLMIRGIPRDMIVSLLNCDIVVS